MFPKRIQRRRTKGWRMPPNTVYVGRPSPLGNPFRCGPYHETAVDLFRQCISTFPVKPSKIAIWKAHGGNAALLIGIASGALVEGIRGKNLACWCRLDQPCHADVLLKLANKRSP